MGAIKELACQKYIHSDLPGLPQLGVGVGLMPIVWKQVTLEIGFLFYPLIFILKPGQRAAFSPYDAFWLIVPVRKRDGYHAGQQSRTLHYI